MRYSGMKDMNHYNLRCEQLELDDETSMMKDEPLNNKYWTARIRWDILVWKIEPLQFKMYS